MKITEKGKLKITRSEFIDITMEVATEVLHTCKNAPAVITITLFVMKLTSALWDE